MLKKQVSEDIFVISSVCTSGTGRARIRSGVTAHQDLCERNTGVGTRGSRWVAERNRKEPDLDNNTMITMNIVNMVTMLF